MHPAQLEVGSMEIGGILEAVDTAAGILRTKGVRAVDPVVFAEDAVVAVNPVDAAGPFIAIKQVARCLGAEDHEVVVEERDVTRNAACLKGGSNAACCRARAGKVRVSKAVARLHAEQS